MKILLKEYNAKKIKTFEDVIDLHQRFEVIHPFQDGNGRVGRLLMFKECLANGFVPFIITDELKMFYCRGLQQWPQFKEYLLDTQKEPYGYACLTNDRKYYEENVPDLVVERAGIDDVILMMTGGEKR